jgi:hypothetical protein
MTIREVLISEISSMPEQRQRDVLSYVRFIKLGLADMKEVEDRFDAAVGRIRKTVKNRGNIAAEVKSAISEARRGGRK